MLDLLTIGRISVDLYGQEEGHGLSDPQTFQKSVGEVLQMLRLEPLDTAIKQR